MPGHPSGRVPGGTTRLALLAAVLAAVLSLLVSTACARGTSATGSPSSPRTGSPTSRTATPVPPPTRTDLSTALRGRDWEVLASGGARVMALTFDAGANDAGVDSILSTLRRTGTPGTFFLTGRFVDAYPSSARAIAAAHRVGDHTADHPYLTHLPDAMVRAQITDGADRIRAVTGADPRPWFRFPYGDADARTIIDANALGYVCIRWTVDSLGWEGTTLGGQSVASVTGRVLAAARPGGIVLLHVGANPDDGTTLDAAALPAIIEGLRRQGYRLVDLGALHP
jgi:peptidoglycan/xylan/chitin deacetylase (PgdA/CDA1 family)